MNLFKVWLIASVGICLAACGGTQTDRTNDNADAASSDSLVIELTGVDSTSVLDLLLASHDVDYSTSANGAFVKAIDSVANGDHCFWIYTVNGAPVSTACNKCFTSDGDTVKWHLKKF